MKEPIAMTSAEQYAVNLVADAIQTGVADDMYQGEGARQGRQIAYDMAECVRENPESFLSWYRNRPAEVKA